MEFSSRRNRKARKIAVESSYGSSLQFYAVPPTGAVSLIEFDEMATERLKILRTVERLNLSGQVKNSEDWMNKLYEDFAKNKYFIHYAEKISESKREEIEAARRRDHVSHFILRLAYCRSEELRRWLIMQETDLFRARFLHSVKNGVDMRDFLITNKLHYTAISAEEFNEERDNLLAGTSSISSGDMMEGRTFFKVSFLEALELVKQRKVYVKGGMAYVPDCDLVTLVTASFRANLAQGLVLTNRVLPEVEDDDRIMRMLQDFDKRYTGKDYTSQNFTGDRTRITPDMIDQLANKSFPLCMRQLNDTLRSTHHLRHGGRLTYGLFLKAAGLSLEDAMYFWRSHFTKMMDVDKFDRQYAYGVRYNYGKEGKRTNYTPYSCVKIITMSVGPGDAHGCPFKECDAPLLKQRLTSCKVPQQVIGEIQELVSKHHYQIACQRYWEATHNATLEAGINHPNQFFDESQKQLNGLATPSQGKKVVPQVKTIKSVMYSQSSSSQDSQASTQQESQIRSESESCDYEFDDGLDSAMLEQYLP